MGSSENAEPDCNDVIHLFLRSIRFRKMDLQQSSVRNKEFEFDRRARPKARERRLVGTIGAESTKPRRRTVHFHTRATDRQKSDHVLGLRRRRKASVRRS